MQDMMHGMPWGMGVVGLLVIAVLVLAAAALLKSSPGDERSGEFKQQEEQT